MGKLSTILDESTISFIRSQAMFFVASAPLDAAGHVNISPKGLDTVRVLDGGRVAYLDLTGSGIETVAHIKENGRVELTRVSQSCGFGVPLFKYEGERPQLEAWAKQKGADGLKTYRQNKNSSSIDGLRGLR